MSSATGRDYYSTRHSALGGLGGIAALGLALGAGEGQAQELRRRLESGPDGQIALSYPARGDVCGSGTSILRIGTSGFNESSWIWSRGESFASCEHGPVRALLTRADQGIVGIRIGIGEVAWPAQATDVGTVAADAAAAYFVDLARRTDGRLGRDALLAAVLADSPAWRNLAELGRNRALSRGLRERAVSWLGREVAGLGATEARELTGVLVAIARDMEEPASLRSRAVSSLARADGSGTAELVGLAKADDTPVAKAALSALGRTTDPRAREAVRRAARDSTLPDQVRLEAIKGLGGRDGTPADLALVRGLWKTLPGSESRHAVLDLIAEAGGSENARWLLAITRDQGQPASVRARAARAAEQAGIGSAELIRLYDEGPDRPVKESILEALIRIGDRAAIDKVVAIAKSDTDPQLRRAAVSRLAKAGNARARAALEDLVEH